MKHSIYIFSLICSTWMCSSCGDGWFNDDDEKVTKTKPEILIGKWDRNRMDIFRDVFIV